MKTVKSFVAAKSIVGMFGWVSEGKHVINFLISPDVNPLLGFGICHYKEVARKFLMGIILMRNRRFRGYLYQLLSTFEGVFPTRIHLL